MLKNLFFPIIFDSNFTTIPDPLSKYYSGQKAIPWLLTVYPGLLITPMALIGLIFHFSKKVFFWCIIFILCLILALGNLTPLHYLFYKLFPFFRFPVKFFFLANFALLVISAYGIERFTLYLKTEKTRQYIVTLFFGLVLFADLFMAHKNLNPVINSDFYKLHHSLLEPVMNDKDIFRIYSDPDIESIKKIDGSILNHHFKWQMMQYPNLGIINNLQDVGGGTGA